MPESSLDFASISVVAASDSTYPSRPMPKNMSGAAMRKRPAMVDG